MDQNVITAKDVRRFLLFLLVISFYPLSLAFFPAAYGAFFLGPYVALILWLIAIVTTIILAHCLIKSIALNFALIALFWLLIEALALYHSKGDAAASLFILFLFTLHFELYLIVCIFWKFD